MTLRAALYARYSTDMQNPMSVEDQLTLCRRHAERLGAVVAAEYRDEGISGRAMGNRPGVLALMHAAHAGGFDLVIAEHPDRLSRGGADTWAIFEDLRALGISIDTVNMGRMTTTTAGVAALVSAHVIEEGARKTRRGLEGVVRSGRSGGGLSYGYRKKIVLDARGEPIRGLREVDEEKAAVVRRIFGEYAAGASPLAIVAGLNRDQVPGPTGGDWTASTIAGNAARGNGIIHNELYNGVIVWGRHAWTKDRRTGRRRARTGAEDGVVRVVDEDLRIVSAELWGKVRKRYEQASAETKGGRPQGARRAKRLLSGLVTCACCNGPMFVSGGALRCRDRIQQGPQACTMSGAPGYAGIEARVLAAVQSNLLHPAVVEAAVRELQAQRQARAKTVRNRRLGLEKELGEVVRRAERLVDQVADGVLEGRMVKDRLSALEARRAELEAEISSAEKSADVVEMPSSVAAGYRKAIERLQAMLEGNAAAAGTIEHAEAAEAFRRIITTVYVRPLGGFGQYGVEIESDLAPLILSDERGQGVTTVGAGVGFEPTTFRL